MKLVEALMEERGITLAYLAQRLHVSQQTISRSVRQRDKVRPSTARAIAAVIGVGLKRIATLDGTWLLLLPTEKEETQ